MLQDVDQDSEHLVCHTPFQSHAKLRLDTNQEIISGVFVDGGLHDCSGVGVHCFRICQRLF